MDDLLIFGGLIMFLVGIVMLITAFVKKTKKKTALLLILIGFVVWIVGGAFVETEPTTQPPTVEEQTENTETEEAPEIAPKEEFQEAITSEQEAIEAVKKYAEEQGFSDPYDKFNASKDGNSYFVMAGHSYLGDSWEGSADMYNVYTSGAVILRGNADAVLAEEVGIYEAQISQSYTFNNYYAYDLKITESSIFGKHVTGYVQNKNNQTSTFVILFRFYDENNIQIGTENQLIENLAPGATATVSVYGPYASKSFDVTDIKFVDVVIY